jgi:hypothetical protein
VVGGEQPVDVAGEPDPRFDQDDQVVADALQVGDQVGGQHDGDALIGDHARPMFT